MVVVLVVSSGAAWESPALTLLQDAPDVVVLKRCVDVDDLLAAATALQADVAVVGLDAAGLDLAAVDHLHAHGVRPVAITPAGAGSEPVRLHAARVGIGSLVPEADLGPLVEAVTGAGDPAGAGGPPDPAVRPARPHARGPPGPGEPPQPARPPPR